tara:strand:+ start:480 stop:1277 length:798 start_codon:yes stop_codon:yes gene_type:complete
MIKITQGYGFFSCCSLRLYYIVDFINSNKKAPIVVDSSEQFIWYKQTENRNEDITFDYFEHYDNVSIKGSKICFPIRFHHDDQFVNYSNINYPGTNPLIKKYFSPSNLINEIINNIEKKYNLIYENICVLFYRGNDKIRETKKCGYHEYLKYANEIISKNNNICFLIQSDETEFIEYMTNKFPNNSLYFKDEIRHMKKCNANVDILMKSENHIYSKKFLAVTIIMSKCKYIICGTGNCDLWIMLYRGNNKNVIQNSNGQWYNNVG